MADLEKPLISEHDSSHVYIKDDGKVGYQDQNCSLRLSIDALSVVDLEGDALLNVHLKDTVGSKLVQKGDSRFVLEVYSYAKARKSSLLCCCCPGELKRRRKVVQLDFHEDSSDCKKWADMINQATLPASQTQSIFAGNAGSDPENTGALEGVPPFIPRKFLVFVNPVSGQGLAQRNWNKTIKQVFEDAQIDVTLVVTQYADHARKYVGDEDPTAYDAILTVGGDGIFYEVLNGLGDRSDGDEVLQKVPIYPLPGGTANGLSESVLHESGESYSILNSAFVAVKGRASNMDVSAVNTKTQSHLAFLSLSWGLISDVDINSEVLRCLGDARLTLAGAYYIGLNRKYRGRLSIYTGKGASGDNANTPPELPPLDQPISEGDGWEVIESAFTLVWTLQTSHVASTMFTAPDRTLSDGYMDVAYTTDISRAGLIKMLLTIDNGEPFQAPEAVVRVKALAYRLEPMDDGILSLDGEVVEYGPIQAVMQRGKARTLKLPQ